MPTSGEQQRKRRRSGIGRREDKEATEKGEILK
jgi:hypothetical protein